MIKFRKLRADEIDVRIGRKVEKDNLKGVILLLYKNARVDMDILDETVGAENWQREHCRENKNCKVGIYCADKGENGQWVWKEDTGTESNTEANKGLASDSFKRACVNWGIGRELYTAPRIYVDAKNIANFANVSFERWTVSYIEYDEVGRIVALQIVDRTGVLVFNYRHKQ